MLSPKQEKILRMRFGIGEDGEHTLKGIADHFGISQEAVRIVEARALRKLRHPTRLRVLKEYRNDHP